MSHTNGTPLSATNGSLPAAGDRYRLPQSGEFPPAELRIQEVAYGTRHPIRGTIAYYPDKPRHPRHGCQPYRCDLQDLDRLWRQA